MKTAMSFKTVRRSHDPNELKENFANSEGLLTKSSKYENVGSQQFEQEFTLKNKYIFVKTLMGFQPTRLQGNTADELFLGKLRQVLI